MLLKTFGWSFGVTAAGLATAAYFWGWQGFAVVAILSVLEISLSFDNAVVNAGVLKKMNAFWQKIFLTIGILIAVFGMRLVFPVVIVAITAKVGPIEAVELAMRDPDQYEMLVTDAHPAIAAFGGMFLLMIFLNFLFDEKEHHWLPWFEKPLGRLGKVDGLAVGIALVVLLVTAATIATEAAQHGGTYVDKSATVLLSGVAGLITYLFVGGLSGYFEDKLEEDEEHDEEIKEQARREGKDPSLVGLAGKAAFFMFLYLEVLDASFSFDGVIGAFAITNHIFWMALGLGIGAMYVRSLTVYLVREGTLDDYVYLEHGAHYAIGALAALLLITIKFHISEVITGLIGVGLIAASFWSSVRRNRGLAAEGHEEKTKVSPGV
ncbi:MULTISPECIES: DUF475 domain-containing protein [Streptomyces]|uniref:DUF475 domain-containing protein n=2 Tax=Streptomyces TaxID=1883 RepID=A0A3R7IXU8_9ACTN|nr:MULTISPECIES: DUF475 domain-containing protein [Streptomyces]KNE80300.1 membrane protein [Streptomyces fradiae]OFA59177.1 hypothetical protein BEN35_02895 [Streptomyces fradiae]PQM24897.1 DUF475 domain-containing protein [Streptomyces xinghaiensis]RKM98949.1 DUF475 domain-containing protein [Streptomyces xinghaiensis]RNC76149.1 DUF475 domain-containing protein [Streptomyces xinghaiensis]